MLSRFSSNVVLAKVRAMYGRNLKKSDYLNLLNCKNIGEIATFLKNHYNYSKTLKDLNENEVHRWQLELLIRQTVFLNNISICRYELSVGEQFSKYIITKIEIEQILHILRLLISDKTPKLIYSIPEFFTKHTIDLNSLGKVKNYEEFINILKKSPYKKILYKFYKKDEKEINLTSAEVAFYTHLYKRIFKVIKKNTIGNTQKELYNIFNSYIDFYNFSRIFRIKKYYNTNLNNFNDFLLPFGDLKPSQIKSMTESESHEKVIKIMSETAPGRKIKNISYNLIDELPMRINYIKCQHFLRFSVKPSVSVIAFIALAEIELSNLINIIEGIRYQIPSEEIQKNLIY